MSSTSFSVLSSFDPYTHWLGIRLDQRPLNPYQLLGLPELETDSSRIRLAAERRRATLDLHRDTDHEEVWYSIQRELEQAVATLLNPDEKALLDASILRRRGLLAALQHEIPESGQPLVCQCQSVNAGSRRFCQACGQVLWAVCLDCGQVCRANEKFCGGCGANREESHANVTKEAEARLAHAQQLRNEHKFREALGVLHQLARSTDIRIDPVIERALKLRRSWQSELQELQRKFTEWDAEALRLWESGNSQQAVSLWRQIPDEELSEHSREVVRSVTNRTIEIQDLEARIQRSVRDKNWNEMGQLINQLLALDAAHPLANSLAQRLAAALWDSAHKCIAAAEFQKACELLQQTPTVARDDRFARESARVAELACLLQAIRQAPCINPTVLGLARRLVNLAPQNERVLELCNRVEARTKSDSRATIPFAKPPRRTAIGIPVELWTGPERCRIEERCAETINSNAAMYAVAVGLAIQGIDAAVINTNLRPEKRQLLASVPFGRRKAIASSWGIDIGNAGIKAVRLVGNASSSPVIDRAIYVPHAHRLSRMASDEQNSEQIQASLAKLSNQADFGKDRVCVALSATASLLKMSRLPAGSRKQLDQAISFEAKHTFPIGLDELFWSYHTFDDEESATNKPEAINVALVAAKRAVINAALAPLRSMLSLDVLQSASLALYNLFAYEHCITVSGEAIAILDIGQSSSSLLVISPEIAWNRSLPVCGDSFTESLVREFQLTTAQAEKWKRDPLQSPKLAPWMDAFDRPLQNLTAELRRSFEMFQREYPQVNIAKLLLVGGAASMHGLMQRLWFGK